LPVRLPGVDAEVIWPFMQSDKKKHAGRLRFVLLRAPGDVFVYGEVTEAQAKRALMTLGDAGRDT